MDGDRSVADGCDLYASRFQEFLRQEGIELLPWQIDVLELYLSHRDDTSDHVGSEDEASQTREMGDGVRSKARLIGKSTDVIIVDELDNI